MTQSRQLSYSRERKSEDKKKKAEMYRKRWMRIRDNKKTDDTPKNEDKETVEGLYKNNKEDVIVSQRLGRSA
ncbi:hypothetical protein KP79_PYT25557 [Mizuhopecten yessoensis]|uniref:Uncharacterized protein n=1 Tax=Mizuhopecten yessoensis TaxID=6573 RepID=A0A210QTS6_MIZYE|nr:hypothetical protein KP79_PYT25557 [Mizuhopecten yessoensis]